MCAVTWQLDYRGQTQRIWVIPAQLLFMKPVHVVSFTDCDLGLSMTYTG
jgi:hypothetical protein